MTSGTPLAPSKSATKTAAAISLASTSACGLSASIMTKTMMEIPTALGWTPSIKAVGPLALPGAVTLTSSTPKMPMQ